MPAGFLAAGPSPAAPVAARLRPCSMTLTGSGNRLQCMAAAVATADASPAASAHARHAMLSCSRSLSDSPSATFAAVVPSSAFTAAGAVPFGSVVGPLAAFAPAAAAAAVASPPDVAPPVTECAGAVARSYRLSTRCVQSPPGLLASKSMAASHRALLEGSVLKAASNSSRAVAIPAGPLYSWKNAAACAEHSYMKPRATSPGQQLEADDYARHTCFVISTTSSAPAFACAASISVSAVCKSP